MFSTIQTIVKETQAVSYTGFFVHAASWLTGDGQDMYYPNPRFMPENVERTGLKSGITIYCVHGTADRSSSFIKVANRLLNLLPDVISGVRLVAFNNRLQGVGIEVFAEELKNKIVGHQDEHVIVMGHSRGGLVAAYFAEYLARDANINVHGILPICSPFGGSDSAVFPLTWLSASVDQMRPGSDFLNALAAKMAVSTIKYHYITVENDSLVLPQAACIPEHRDRRVCFDRHGHLSIMTSQRLVEHIGNCLDEICWSLLLSISLSSSTLTMFSADKQKTDVILIRQNEDENEPVLQSSPFISFRLKTTN